MRHLRQLATWIDNVIHVNDLVDPTGFFLRLLLCLTHSQYCFFFSFINTLTAIFHCKFCGLRNCAGMLWDLHVNTSLIELLCTNKSDESAV